jgi:hypothetical protein
METSASRVRRIVLGLLTTVFVAQNFRPSGVVVSAFQPPYLQRRQSSASFVVFGVRQALRRKVLSLFSRSSPPVVNLQTFDPPLEVPLGAPSKEEVAVLTLEKEDEDESPKKDETAKDQVELASNEEAKEPKRERAVQVVNPILSSYTEDIMNRLPPVDRELTELEVEFRGMVAHFSSYSSRDILCLRDLHVRILFEGVIASTDEPLVYRAFEILYEDLYVLRIGGRIVYRKLEKIMEESIKAQAEEVANVVASTGLGEDSVREARLSFLAVAMTLNGNAYLTLSQLASAGLTDTAVDLLGFESAQAFLKELDAEKKGRLTFSEMMLGLHACAEKVCAIEYCNAAETVRQVVLDIVEHPPVPPSDTNPKRERIVERYNEMVGYFRGWEGLLPVEEQEDMGRRQARTMEVVRGCFKGAEVPNVVHALRVLYVDYSPLRVAGDFIFGVVATIMKKRQKNSQT